MAPHTQSLPWYVRELTGRRLVWNIMFYVGHVAIFAYGWHKQAADPRLAGLNQLKFSVWISRGAGLALGVDGLLLLVPVLRNIVAYMRPKLAFALPLDENVWFHRQIAYSLLFFTIVHTTAHYTQPGGFTGHVMLLIMFLMYTTAHAKIRHQCFEAFWYTHHLAFFFLLGLYTHATGCFVRGGLPGQPTECLGYESWRWTIWGGILYFVERVWREIRARKATKLAGVLMHPSGTMEIRFIKPSMKYKAGMWLFLNVPDVSTFQWHPFTISSAPEDPYISVHVRQAGDFTKALGERLGCTALVAAEATRSAGQDKKGYGDNEFIDVSSSVMARGGMPLLRIDGPYGAPAEDVFKHEVAVLIGAGIGVTPFASILKNIWYMQQRGQLGALRKVEFFLINRDSGSMEWFSVLLKTLEDAQTDPDFLRIHMYLTGKIDADTMANIAIHDSGAEFDPLTDLRSRTGFGRPDFHTYFIRLRNAIERGAYLKGQESCLTTRVGVFYCGPSAMARTIKDEALAASSATVKFSFAKEHF